MNMNEGILLLLLNAATRVSNKYYHLNYRNT